MNDQYRQKFIDFLIRCGALTFGEFTLKSGRIAPYFINTGKFDSGEKIHAVARFYAQHAQSVGFERANVIFGPAYKGIPLAVATSMVMEDEFKRECYFSFDRKEAKEHGDKGVLVGRALQPADRAIIVEDVITAGTTLAQIIPFIRSFVGVELLGVIAGVDRAERGTTSANSALKQIEIELGVKVSAIVSIHEIIDYLSKENPSGLRLSEQQLSSVNGYLKEFGA